MDIIKLYFYLLIRQDNTWQICTSECEAVERSGRFYFIGQKPYGCLHDSLSADAESLSASDFQKSPFFEITGAAFLRSPDVKKAADILLTMLENKISSYKDAAEAVKTLRYLPQGR